MYIQKLYRSVNVLTFNLQSQEKERRFRHFDSHILKIHTRKIRADVALINYLVDNKNSIHTYAPSCNQSLSLNIEKLCY